MFDSDASPSRTRIKFCGMTRAEDIALACELDVDAIGLVFAERSPRRVAVETAAVLRKTMPASVRVVALFMDQGRDEVQRVVDVLRPDLLQFHGNETADDCEKFGVPYLKAVAMGGATAEDAIAVCEQHPHAHGFLFDSHAQGQSGGSGRPFDWSQLPRVFSRPWLLAGGLSSDNVFDAIRLSGCHGVDVSSGIESAPGVKDHERMRRFVAEVRRADGML